MPKELIKYKPGIECYRQYLKHLFFSSLGLSYSLQKLTNISINEETLKQYLLTRGLEHKNANETASNGKINYNDTYSGKKKIHVLSPGFFDLCPDKKIIEILSLYSSMLSQWSSSLPQYIFNFYSNEQVLLPPVFTSIHFRNKHITVFETFNEQVYSVVNMKTLNIHTESFHDFYALKHKIICRGSSTLSWDKYIIHENGEIVLTSPPRGDDEVNRYRNEFNKLPYQYFNQGIKEKFVEEPISKLDLPVYKISDKKKVSDGGSFIGDMPF